MKLTVKRALAAVIDEMVGAPGKAAGITLTRGLVAGPDPAIFVARTET